MLIIEIIFYFFTCFLNLLDPYVSFKQIDNIYFSTVSIARYLMIFDISYISSRLLDMSTTECEYFFFGNLLGSFFDKNLSQDFYQI